MEKIKDRSEGDSLMAKGDCTRVRDDAQNISALQLKEQNINSSYTRKNIKQNI